MADDRTFRRTKRLKIFKDWSLPIVGAALGLLLDLTAGYSPVEFITEWIGKPLKALGIGKVHDWDTITAGFLPIVSGPLAGFLLGLGGSKQKTIRAAIDWILPDPPFFARSNIARERLRTLTLLESGDRATPAAFFGRQAELSDLLTFAHTANGPFLWRSVLGPTGIGKTRLSVEWLAALDEQGWDVGVADRSHYPLASKWRARRKTALVIDDAGRNWGRELGPMLAALHDGSRRTAPVRLLVVDQIAPGLAQANDPDLQRLLSVSRHGKALALPSLDDGAIDELWRLWRADDQPPLRLEHLRAETGGRARAVILMAKASGQSSYWEALASWAEDLLPELADEPGDAVLTSEISLLRALALSVLGGPVPLQVVRAVCGTDFDVHRLKRFFPFANLSITLPAFDPEDLGQEILLRAMAYLGSGDATEIMEVALANNPDTVERTLWSLWSERPEVSEAVVAFYRLADAATDPLAQRAACLAELQRVFDRRCPQRVAAALQEVTWVVEQALSGADLEAAIEHFSRLVSRRPHDASIRLYEAYAVLDLVTYCGKKGRFDDLERWGARLIVLSETEPFKSDLSVKRAEAKGTAHAIIEYGLQDRFEDLERWGARLMALTATDPFRGDRDIRTQEAVSASNATSYYGMAGRSVDLERWGARLIALAETEAFRSDPEIRLAEAIGSKNAISNYAKQGRFEDLERWGARLIALAEAEPFRSDPEIRLAEAESASNATYCYASAGRSEDLERWGTRLIALGETEPFRSDPAIRLCEAIAAANATSDYARQGRFEDLERWGARLIALAETEPFRSDPAIRAQEASGSSSALLGYGLQDRFEDLERWGMRLIALAENETFKSDLSIKRAEAEGAANGVISYGLQGRFEDLERWGARLIALAATEPFQSDPDIGFAEMTGAAQAISAYGRLGAAGSMRRSRWFGVLAKCAQRFPTGSKIQALAHEFNLSLVEQERRGWPYGRL